MSFRLRVTLIAAAAVAAVALGISVLNYVLLQTELTDEFDRTLVQAAAGAQQFGDRPADRPRTPGGACAILGLAGRGARGVRRDHHARPDRRSIARAFRTAAITMTRPERMRIAAKTPAVS